MKLNGQNISGTLGNLLLKLVNAGTQDLDGNSISRERKSARDKKTARKKSKTVLDVEKAVDAMIKYFKDEEGDITPGLNRWLEIEALKRGDFSSGYWVQCDQLSDVALYCIPSNTPDTGPRNYSYPDPAFNPSILGYGEGVETEGHPRMDGMMIGGYFRETMYKWHRYTFELKNPCTITNKEVCFIKITGPVIGNASEQACRSLLSVVYKCWLVLSGSSRLTTYEPPTETPVYDWFKYVTPRGVPPYWEETRVVNISRSVTTLKYMESGGDCTNATVLVGPAPSKGHRFNNNDTVSCEFAPTVELWQIKKTSFREGLHETNTGGWEWSVWGSTFNAKNICKDLNLVPVFGGYTSSAPYNGLVDWYTKAGTFISSTEIPWVEDSETIGLGVYGMVTACVTNAGLVIATLVAFDPRWHILLITPTGVTLLAYVPFLSLNGGAALFRYEQMYDDQKGNCFIYRMIEGGMSTWAKITANGVVSTYYPPYGENPNL